MGTKAYGIDLGTTFSAIAVVDGEETRIVKNSDGYETTPSVVFFSGDVNDADEDETFVGIEAKNQVALNPAAAVQFVKRHMGEPDFRFISPSGKEYSAEALSALILRKVCQGAESFEGEGAVQDVVITVPAYFDDARRVATKQAGAIAGLNVLRVINEPTAAAIAYGLDAGQDGKVLVYDLGGGTFDVTVMRITGKDFDVIATGGDHMLGGVDFDNVVRNLIENSLVDQGCPVSDDDDVLQADMQAKAERAKIQLSEKDKAKIPFTVAGKTYRVEVTREDFEQASKVLMDRTQYLLEKVLSDANLTWADIDQVLAVGGSTRMPMARHQLEALSGKAITYKVDPDTAVARGAAIFASTLNVSSGENGAATNGAGAKPVPAIGDGLAISDVTSQSLGVITVDSQVNRSKRVNTIIIPHNTKIPAKRSEICQTLVDNQTRLKVEVTEGNDEDVDYVRIIGSSLIEIPPYPAGAPVEIVYAYDPDQTIFVEVIDKTANKSLGTFEIERTANLSENEIARASDMVRGASVD